MRNLIQGEQIQVLSPAHEPKYRSATFVKYVSSTSVLVEFNDSIESTTCIIKLNRVKYD